MKKLENLYIASGNINGAATTENSLPVSQKVKHRIALWPSNFIPKYLPKRIENRYLNKHLFMNIHSSTVYNSQILKIAQMCTNSWMGKQNVVYP